MGVREELLEIRNILSNILHFIDMAHQAVKTLGAQVGLRTKNSNWSMKGKMKACEPVGP